MFENLIGQETASIIAADLRSGAFPPAVLFAGPAASGKGTAALELARALSCENPEAPWNCACPACTGHRNLAHPDLLILGGRGFSAEIAASASAYLREPESAARLLFVRSLKKLTARFSPILWEGEESKLGKLAPLISGLSDGIEDLSSLGSLPEASREDARGKLCDSLLHGAYKLESEGVPDTVPIAQVRRAAYWARLAPSGKRKLILIEQADRMQDSARNALLKILEEPPGTTQLVLCTTRRGAMLPTILSRLRTYAFARRSVGAESEVVRRVFRDNAAAERMVKGDAGSSGAGVTAYLEGFLPVPPDSLDGAAAFFAASAAAAAVLALRRAGNGRQAPETLVSLGRACAERSREAGFGRPEPDGRSAAAAVSKAAESFEVRSLFPVFLARLLSHAGPGLRNTSLGPSAVVLAQKWTAAARTAEIAVGTYNQNPLLALERLFVELSDGAEAACAGDGA